MRLLRRVARYVHDQDLFGQGATLVLGVSGGPDSLCLLDLLHRLAGRWGLTLHVAHLDHQLRAESAQEAEGVRALAGERGLAFHLSTADVRAHSWSHRQSLETAARQLRYAFLAEVAEAVGAQAVAVGHTADDQAETVLMHFLRGSGLAGLRGMLPNAEIGIGSAEGAALRLVRPLLDVTRAEVEMYCAERRLQPAQDASNWDRSFLRNRLRHDLLPELERYNPNLRAALRRTAASLAGDEELLRPIIDALWLAQANLAPGQVWFDRARWLALSVPAQRALLRRAAASLSPESAGVDFAPLEAAVRFSRSAAVGRNCQLPKGLRLKLTAGRVTLLAREEEAAPPAGPLLDEAGQLPLGWALRAERLESWPAQDLAAAPGVWRAWVDAARITAPLEVRGRRPGDWFQPLGMGGRRVKLSDFMINHQIPASQRGRWPLVVCGSEIVWVAGLRLDERFRVMPETRAVLRLALERIT